MSTKALLGMGHLLRAAGCRPLFTIASQLAERDRRWRWQVQLAALATYDDYLLRDMGITRQDLAWAMAASNPENGWKALLNARGRTTVASKACRTVESRAPRGKDPEGSPLKSATS